MPDPGHFGAANRFGPTVCLKCTASYSTPAHRCFCLLGCENRWSLPNTPPGYWALCTLLSYDSAPFLSCGKFPSGVRQGPVIACHLSGPCPRGPCGAGGLLDLPLVPLCRPRAACAASAGRAGGSWFFNSQPLTTPPQDHPAPPPPPEPPPNPPQKPHGSSPPHDSTDTLHLRLPDGRPILFWVLVLVGACQSGTVWAGLCLIHHHQAPWRRVRGGVSFGVQVRSPHRRPHSPGNQPFFRTNYLPWRFLRNNRDPITRSAGSRETAPGSPKKMAKIQKRRWALQGRGHEMSGNPPTIALE